MTELLQEFVDSRGVTVSVDREIGILRGVKLIGLESRNGRRYRESALKAAAGLYEEAKVNVNHPKEGPLAPRDYQDRIGVIRAVKVRSGEGLFGDLHFNPKHALAEQLLWDAQHNPRNVGFSHNVLARLTREGETSVIEEITKVQSVDLVADPATTQGLFEQEAAVSAHSKSDKPAWDVLTLEVLKLNRPDLYEEIQSQEMASLKRLLEKAESQKVMLKRKQRIFELLCEYQLSVADKPSPSNAGQRQMISPLFVKLLMHVSDESELERLVAERAELANGVMSRSQRFNVPQSRDQMVLLANAPTGFTSAQDFAETLKMSRN